MFVVTPEKRFPSSVRSGMFCAWQYLERKINGDVSKVEREWIISELSKPVKKKIKYERS
jgi:hypothetical protein